MKNWLKVKNFLTKTLKYIFNIKNISSNWGQLLLLLIPIILTIQPLLQFISNNTYMICLTIIVFIIGWGHSINNLANGPELVGRIDKLDMEKEYLNNMLDDVPVKVMKAISLELNFQYNERISIYRFNNDDEFVSVGRYSINTNIKKSWRSSYPNNEGFIGKTWNNGSFHIDELPDPSKAIRNYINKVTSTCDISEEVLEKINMKSRSYYCRNLLENNEPLAVIVFESLTAKLPATVDEIDKLIDGPWGQLLVNVIKTNLPLVKE